MAPRQQEQVVYLSGGMSEAVVRLGQARRMPTAPIVAFNAAGLSGLPKAFRHYVMSLIAHTPKKELRCDQRDIAEDFWSRPEAAEMLALLFPPHLKDVLLGVTPEFRYDPAYFEHFPEITEQINGHSKLLLGPIGPTSDGKRSLFNLKAVMHVVDRNRDLFPPLGTANIAQWLTDCQEEWDPYCAVERTVDQRKAVDARYGLLSGFDGQSVRIFPAYLQAVAKIDEYYDQLCEHNLSQNELRSALDEFPGKPALTVEEKELILKRFAFEDISYQLGYFAFDAAATQRQHQESQVRVEACNLLRFRRGHDLYTAAQGLLAFNSPRAPRRLDYVLATLEHLRNKVRRVLTG